MAFMRSARCFTKLSPQLGFYSGRKKNPRNQVREKKSWNLTKDFRLSIPIVRTGMDSDKRDSIKQEQRHKIGQGSSL
jgi:hypothetical protein